MFKWMSDDELDPYVKEQLEATNSPHDLDYWRELLTAEPDKEAWLRVGAAFLSELDITVVDVRDADDMLEWLVKRLPGWAQ